MLYSYFTEKFVGLQDLSTNKIHDYRKQLIKDIPAFGKHVILKLRKRRYLCHKCGKRFYENVSFLPKYRRMTSRLVTHILNKLQYEYSFTSVVREMNLSVSTILESLT